jgi:RimJ/RimL family protein N-acetyltransferase
MPEVCVLIEDGSSVPLTTAYALMKSIYESTDTFVADFADEFPSVEALRKYLAGIEALPGGMFLVARDGDEPVAFLLVKPRPQLKIRHTAELNMGVCAAVRGRGIAGCLLGEALARVRGEGKVEIVYLKVRADNHAAIRVYERAGFEALTTLVNDTRIESRYYDGILMRLSLRDGV